MQSNELSHIIEAILFIAGEPLHVDELGKALDVSQLELMSAIDDLESDYNYNRRGICLKRFGNHIQLATRSEYAKYVEQLLQPVQKQSLSQTAMETLAVVAYKQPVTKSEVEAVRGVKCDYSIQSLAAKGLIVDVGRKEALGRPILYGTTDFFLSHFGIRSLDELPALPDMQKDDSVESELMIP